MAVTTLRDTPYQGLVPYSEQDEQFFFGREMEQEVIAGNLMASRLTLLYGPSGVGKSSVLHAGVAAGVRNQSRENVAAKGVPRFVLVIFRDWKDDPLKGLLHQVRTAVTDAFQGEPFEPVPPNLSFADELSQWADRIGGKLLIVLDQFEEYFLYPEKKNGTSFGVQFPHAVNKSDLRVNFLVSIREDWLAKLDHFKVDLPSLFDNYLRMEGLERKAARDAIEQPVARYNVVRKANEPEITLHKDFAGTVLDQLEKLANKNVLAESGSGQVKDGRGSERGKTRIQPPYLQLVMIYLWREAVASNKHELHPRMLDDPNMAETIIQSHLEQVMSSLNDDEREAAASVFNHLVTPSGIKIAQSLPDLAAFADLSEEQIAPVLDKLSSKESGILSQLVPPPGQPAEARYEIYHDVLAPAVVRWCNTYKDAKKLHEAQERAEADRLIARQQRQVATRLRLLSIALGVITLLAVLFAVFGLGQFKRAQAQKSETEAQRAKNAIQEQELLDTKRNVEDLTQKSNKARQDAEAAIAKAGREEIKARTAEKESEKAAAMAKEEKRKADASNREAANAKERAAASNREADDAKVKANASKVEVDTAKKREMQYGHAIDLSREATSYYRAKNPKVAIEKYEELLKVYQDLGDKNGQADTNFELGGIAAGLPVEVGTTSKAPEYYNHALDLYRQTNNRKGEADTLLALVPLYPLDKGAEAFDTLVKVVDLYQQVHDLDNFYTAVFVLQSFNTFQIDPQKELDSREKLLKVFSESKKEFSESKTVADQSPYFVENQVVTLRRMGELHFGLGDKRKALESYRAASDLSDSPYFPKIVGDLYYQQNDKQKALAAYLKSDSLFKPGQYSPDVDQGIVLLSIADIYRQLNDKEKAIQFYRRLQDVPYWRCVALLRLAEIYVDLHDKQSAVDQLVQIVLPDQNQYCFSTVVSGEFVGPVLEPIVEKPSKDFEVELLTRISSLYKELGNPKKAKDYADLAEERQKRNP